MKIEIEKEEESGLRNLEDGYKSQIDDGERKEKGGDEVQHENLVKGRKDGENQREEEKEVGFNNSTSKLQPQTHEFVQNLKASEVLLYSS